jgi:hypothetical protein
VLVFCWGAESKSPQSLPQSSSAGLATGLLAGAELAEESKERRSADCWGGAWAGTGFDLG